MAESSLTKEDELKLRVQRSAGVVEHQLMLRRRARAHSIEPISEAELLEAVARLVVALADLTVGRQS